MGYLHEFDREDKFVNEIQTHPQYSFVMYNGTRYLNNRMYNFPIWKSIEAICREAVVRFALSACRSKLDAASFLGLSLGELNINLKKMNIFLDNNE